MTVYTFPVPSRSALFFIPATLYTLLTTFSMALRLGTLYRDIKPDLVHLHLFPAGLAGVLALRSLDCPLIYGAQYSDREDLQALKEQLLGDLLLRWMYRRIDAVQAVSSAVADSARAAGARETRIIPNGVRFGQPFEPASWRPGQPLRLITISHLEYRNGLDLLLKACRQLLSRQPKLDWSLRIVGDGSRRAYLEQLSEQLGLASRVEFTGACPHDSVPEFLQEADLFVRPSRQEGFGISFIEAMAAGRIPIGTRVGGIPDIITHMDTGYLARPEHVESLTDMIEQALKDAELWPEMIRRAQEDVCRRFDWTSIIESLETLYTEVAELHADES